MNYRLVTTHECGPWWWWRWCRHGNTQQQNNRPPSTIQQPTSWSAGYCSSGLDDRQYFIDLQHVSFFVLLVCKKRRCTTSFVVCTMQFLDPNNTLGSHLHMCTVQVYVVCTTDCMQFLALHKRLACCLLRKDLANKRAKIWLGDNFFLRIGFPLLHKKLVLLLFSRHSNFLILRRWCWSKVIVIRSWIVDCRRHQTFVSS